MLTNGLVRWYCSRFPQRSFTLVRQLGNMKFINYALGIVIIVAAQSVLAFESLPYGVSSECGPRYEQFLQHFHLAGFPEKAASIFVSEALMGYDVATRKDKKKLGSFESRAKLEKFLSATIQERISEPSGLLELVSCWHSRNAGNDFDFPESAALIQHIENAFFGSQTLSWLSSEWCARNWDSIYRASRNYLKKPIPIFRPILWCNPK